MSSLDLVRAEIKSWERDFASRHGRDPSVQDIRDQPSIAEKYKLYKKLSKSFPKARSGSPNPVPPLPGFNPFSPTKKTALLRQTSRHPNPFATPTKSVPKPRTRISPEPPANVCISSSHTPPVPTTAVSRARKRLRGEPVSPSPSKPKRQCIRSQALPSFPKLEQDSSNSESDQELPHCDLSSSFVADSPVKAPAGGKSFKLLFDDALPALSIPKRPISAFVADDSPPSDASFSRVSTDPPVITSRKLHNDLTSRKSVISGLVHQASRTQSTIFPTKDHLPATSHRSSFTTLTSRAPQPRTSMKRALDSDDLANESGERSASSRPKYPLIPPSPPQESINRDTGKGKTKVVASRKKLRFEDEESDEGVEDVTLRVAIVGLNRDKRLHRHADVLDWDPSLRLATRNHDPAVTQPSDANHHVSGTFSVDLPEKLRRVLAVSPSRNHDRMEERVVRGLLYGDRVGHYNPSRGGIIWDAGEVDNATDRDAETEDDWEGEPVPWEVGEL